MMLLHTVLPHVHEDHLCGEESETIIQSADDLFGYFGLPFHVDLGEGHLEDYQSGQGLDYNLEASFAVIPLSGLTYESFHLTSIKEVLLEDEHYLCDDPFPDSHLKKVSSLRGPPVLS